MEDAVSTDTESCEGFEVAQAVAKKKPRVVRPKKLQEVNSPWNNFVAKFHSRLASCRASNTGCSFCLHECFIKLEPLLDEIRKWRSQMSEAHKDIADKELFWIFHRSEVDKEEQAQGPVVRKRPVPCDLEEGCSTSTSEMSDRHGCQNAQESTSTSEPSDGANDLLDLGGIEASTASSKSIVPSSSTLRQPSRQYKDRASTKKPSVRFYTFLAGADKSTTVCVRAAMFALGIGGSRLHRVA